MKKLTVCNVPIADYSIVLSAEPALADQTAAEFLQRVVRTACGVELKIAESADHALYLGTNPPGETVRFDGYRIAVVSDLHAERFGEKQEELIAMLRDGETR